MRHPQGGEGGDEAKTEGRQIFRQNIPAYDNMYSDSGWR